LELFLLLELFFVQFLAEFLDFTPFIIADVRWHVLHLIGLESVFLDSFSDGFLLERVML